MSRARCDERSSLRLLSAIWLVCACLLSMFASADVSGLDAGELGGAAWSLGVAHPSGFPLDMLLLRAAALLPLGSLAFRQNLAVSLIASAAVSSVAYACQRLVRQCGSSSDAAATAGACACAAALLGSRTFLDAALSVEVYATALLCVAGSVAARRALWPLVGLALGAHITAALLFGPIVIASTLRTKLPARHALASQVLCLGFGALVLSYVPLASLHNGAFDWGDPQTLARWFRHLTAARIREAYADALFTRDALPRVRLLQQLTEHAYVWGPAAVGIVWLWRRQRPRALVLGLLLSLDLAYGAWINPMGVAQRQVGHASSAILAVFAGCGCAALVAWLQTRSRNAGTLAAWFALGAGLLTVWQQFAPTSSADGYVVSERYGAASPLVELPPHAVYVCANDSACASALFAVYAEGVRPDLDVVPAQHLWDPTVLRRLRGLGDLQVGAGAGARAWPPVAQRRSLAQRRLRALFSRSRLRPVYLERIEAVEASVFDLRHVPFVGLASVQVWGAPSASLRELERARFGPAGPRSPLACELWASAHATLGAVYLRDGHNRAAVTEFSRAVSLTPRRAAAHSNLGVALEQQGDLERALQQTARAVELDPLRATPWVNLARLVLRLRGPQAAHAALANARRYHVRDARLDELARELQALNIHATGPWNPPQGTTRK